MLGHGSSETEIEGARKRFAVMGHSAWVRSAEQGLELESIVMHNGEIVAD
jgi:hypothetical protein